MLFWPEIIEKLQSFQIRGNLIDIYSRTVHNVTCQAHPVLVKKGESVHMPPPRSARQGVTNVLFWPEIIEKLQSFQIRGNLIDFYSKTVHM